MAPRAERPPLRTALTLLTLVLPTVTAPVPRLRLANGVAMPQMLFGTPSCGAPNPDQACVNATRDAVAAALRCGFPGVDSAHHYGNQLGVAAALAKSRSTAAWVTSKVEACNTSFVRPGHCDVDTRSRFMDDLLQLNASSVDLMLLHAPTSTSGGSQVYPGPEFGSASCNCSEARACTAMQQQWAAMEDLYKAGKARAIGVSNYCVACLDCLAKTSTVQPMVNQIRLHVGMDVFVRPDPVVAACRARGIVLQAYSPLGSGSSAVLKSNLTRAIGAAHGVSSAQVALRWLAAHGVAIVTRTTAEQVQYMREDLSTWNWTLKADEMPALDAATFANQSSVKTMCLA